MSFPSWIRSFVRRAAGIALLESRLGLSRRKIEAPKQEVSSVETPASKARPHDSVQRLFTAWAQEEQGVRGYAIHRDVLPLYSEMFKRASTIRTIPTEVTVTPICWPYT